jgi:hypothetical protein
MRTIIHFCETAKTIFASENSIRIDKNKLIILICDTKIILASNKPTTYWAKHVDMTDNLVCLENMWIDNRELANYYSLVKIVGSNYPIAAQLLEHYSPFRVEKWIIISLFTITIILAISLLFV